MAELLRLENIHKHFSLPGKRVLGALNGVNLSVEKGEILGIVGESGCGKSTLAKVIMGIYRPDTGALYYKGEKLDLGKSSQRKEYSKKVQMVFQNPYASLNPKLKAAQIVGEGLYIHGKFDKKKLEELFSLVGLGLEHGDRYAHEFSGGQRQRLGIARALAMNPEFLVCDEPISALDVSIQSQIVNLLSDLQKNMGLTLLFIAHDLNMVRYLSHRIAVMYLGNVVEIATGEELCTKPAHPYSQMLLNAVLTPDPERKKLDQMPETFGQIQSPLLPIIGCPFVSRCTKKLEQCKTEKPLLKEVTQGHSFACHLEVTQ